MQREVGRRVAEFREKLAENPGAMFHGVLSEEEINEECLWLGHVWRERIFTPLVTLWTFLNQVLEIGSSCGEAVGRMLSYLSVTTGLDASHDPSAYSKARKRLPEDLAPRLTRRVAEKLASKVGAKHLWHGRRVKLVDGSSVALWDTPENQAAYPQPKGQSPGCGFPVARIVGLFFQSDAIRRYVDSRPSLRQWLYPRGTTSQWRQREGYQLLHSKLAIGSGGALGFGYGKGPYVKYPDLPDRHNDFIFAMIGHQWGLAGAMVVLLLFACIAVCGLEIAARTIRAIKEEGLCDGVHVMAIGREELVPEILEMAGL